ncbi:MATE family efflux transporter [Holdemanella hominis]|uniref:MATE family efflux transporter n=1 Tax=Holdemanella hominis TaxID=2764327 RepID=UPI002108400A|nr:MATE family efflux transporter [Holdemanella hominis]
MKNHSLTQGSIAKGLLFFVIPLFFSNLFQQLYNTIDTLLVGHFLGDNALAAMGATANVIKLRNDGFEGNTKNVLLFFFENLNFLLTYR